MKRVIRIIAVFVLVGTYLLGCRNEEQKINSEVTDTISTQRNNYEQIFKTWLKDTLPNLYKWQITNEANIIKKEVLLDNDSLRLNTNCYYAVSIDETKNKNLPNEIVNMIELLKEYDELPKKDYSLSFVYKMDYSPSVVEQLKHDFIYDINNIVVEELGSKTNYSYIRGRFSNKQVIRKRKGDNLDTMNINFIWDGDKLIKK